MEFLPVRLPPDPFEVSRVIGVDGQGPLIDTVPRTYASKQQRSNWRRLDDPTRTESRVTRLELEHMATLIAIADSEPVTRLRLLRALRDLGGQAN
jgi:hypothetical protein